VSVRRGRPLRGERPMGSSTHCLDTYFSNE
jgi:hypothetical protein